MKKTQTLFFILLCIILIVIIILLPDSGSMYDINKSTFETKNNFSGIIKIGSYGIYNSENGTKYNYINNKIKEYEKNNPGIFIELVELEYNVDLTVLNDFKQKKLDFDILPVGNDIDIIKSGYLEDISSYINTSNYNEQVIDNLSFSGKLYGYPVAVTPYLLGMNMKLFNEYNIKPLSPNPSINEFNDKLLEIEKAIDGKAEIFPIRYNYQDIAASAFISTFENEFLSGKDINKKNIINGFDMLSFHKNYISGKADGEIYIDFISKDKVFIYPITGRSIAVNTVLNRADKGVEIKVANYPQVSQNNILLGKVENYAILKNDDTEKVEIMIDFLNYLIDEDFKKNLTNCYLLPVDKNFNNIYSESVIMKDISKVINYNLPLYKKNKYVDYKLMLDSAVKNYIDSIQTSEQSAENILEYINNEE